jgi:hypothetical protein
MKNEKTSNPNFSFYILNFKLFSRRARRGAEFKTSSANSSPPKAPKVRLCELCSSASTEGAPLRENNKKRATPIFHFTF